MGLGDKARLLPGRAHNVGGMAGASSRHHGAAPGDGRVSRRVLRNLREDPGPSTTSTSTRPTRCSPSPDRDDRLETKDVVLGVQLNDSYKAYSSEALREHRIVNDVVGGEGDTGAGVGRKRGR